METPTKPSNPKICISCSKSPTGHLRDLQKVVKKDSSLGQLYSDLQPILNFDIKHPDNKGLEIHQCDACLKFFTRFSELISGMKSNISILQQNKRSKRIITHTPSEKSAKRQTNPITITPRQLFNSNTEDLTSNADEVCDQLMISGSGSSMIDHLPDHLYCSNTTQLMDHSSLSVIKTFSSIDRAVEEKELQHIETLLDLLKTNRIKLSEFSRQLIKIPSLEKSTHAAILLKMDSDMVRIAAATDNNILKSDIASLNNPHIFKRMIHQLMTYSPLLMKTLITICNPFHGPQKNNTETILAMYAMGMNSRNSHLSAFQKLISCACLRHHAGNEVKYP